MRRVAPFAVIVAACGNAAVVPCSVEQSVTAEVAGNQAFDVGTFVRGSANYTDAAMVSAQSDLLNAVKRGQTFRLVYDANDAAMGNSQRLQAGWSGALRGGVLRLSTYAGEVDAKDPTVGLLVTSRSCDIVQATPGCTPTVGVPCLECIGPDTGTIVCRN